MKHDAVGAVLMVLVGFFLGVAFSSHPKTAPVRAQSIDPERARGAAIVAVVLLVVSVIF